MEKLLTKINYRGDQRICIINGEKSFIKNLSDFVKDLQIDKSVEPKFLYNFIMIFAKSSAEVEESAHSAIHNLYEDGILWYLYPKNPDDSLDEPLTRDKGWDACQIAGFEAVRHICIDDNLSATRFRNKNYIKRRSKKQV